MVADYDGRSQDVLDRMYAATLPGTEVARGAHPLALESVFLPVMENRLSGGALQV